MVREKFSVRLTREERDRLEHLVRAGRSPARVAAASCSRPTRAGPLPRWPRLWRHSIPHQRFAEDAGRRAPGPAPSQPVPQAPGRVPSHRWPAPRVPRGMTTGRCGPLRAGRWSWDWWSRCPTRACVGIIVAEEAVVHFSPHGGRWTLRLCPQGQWSLPRPPRGWPMLAHPGEAGASEAGGLRS